jgi:hypothetical protein
MSLRLPRVATIKPEDEDAVRDMWGTEQTVLDRLAKKGITMPEPPTHPFPEISTTIVAETEPEFLRVNNQWMSWRNYISSSLSITEGFLLEITNEMTNLETMIRGRIRNHEEDNHIPKRDRVSDQYVQDQINSDPRYIELSKRAQEYKQERLIMQGRLDIITASLKALSRSVTVRQIDTEVNRNTAGAVSRRAYHFGGNDDR